MKISALLLLVVVSPVFASEYSFSGSFNPPAPGQFGEGSAGAFLVFNTVDAFGNSLPPVVDGATLSYFGASGSGSFTVGSHSVIDGVLIINPVSGSFPDLGDDVSYTFSGDAVAGATLTDVCTRLDSIKTQNDTLIFLFTAGAFGVGALLGAATWFFAIKAMHEEDF